MLSSPNPYEPPRHGGWDETNYYTTVVTRLTWAEIWRILRPNFPAILAVMAKKLLGGAIITPLAISHDAEQFLAWEDTPEAVRDAVQLDCDTLRNEGFVPCFAHTTPALGDWEGYGMHLLHPQGHTWATLVWARYMATGLQTTVVVSRLRENRLLSTTNARRQLTPPPYVEPVYLPGAPVSAVIARHRERLAQLNLDTVVKQDAEALRATVVWMGQELVAFHRARGVWRPLTFEEMQQFAQVHYGRNKPEG